MKVAASRALVQVGHGRGFVIKANAGRFVVTAAHCLPKLPPPASISHVVERTYKNLLGAVGERCTVWTECVFVDPVADIAVLDSPDTQELSREADAYDRLIEAALPLRVSELGSKTVKARLLPLDGPSFRCEVKAVRRGPLWIEKPALEIEGGMSGSPILVKDGLAIGVVVTPYRPNPRLASHLPGWLLGEIGAWSSTGRRSKR